MSDIKLQVIKLLRKCPKCGSKIFLTLGVLLLIICLVFLGNILSQSTDDVRLVASLQKQVAKQVVDMEMWENINKQFEWKKQPLEESEKINKNPFE